MKLDASLAQDKEFLALPSQERAKVVEFLAANDQEVMGLPDTEKVAVLNHFVNLGKQTSPVTQSPKPEQQDGGILQTAGNLLAGGVRGAGSIGATILSPLDALGVTGMTNEQRRKLMDEGLQEMGADPESLAYKGGKLGAEVAGTMGVGGAMGRGLLALSPKLAPTAAALETGGLGKGAQALGYPGRVAAGAATGGAAGMTINPEDTMSGMGMGAALPGVAPVFSKVINPVVAGATGPMRESWRTSQGRKFADEMLGDSKQLVINAISANKRSDLTAGDMVAGANIGRTEKFGSPLVAIENVLAQQPGGLSDVAKTMAAKQEAKVRNLVGGVAGSDKKMAEAVARRAAVTDPMREDVLTGARDATKKIHGYQNIVSKAENAMSATKPMMEVPSTSGRLLTTEGGAAAPAAVADTERLATRHDVPTLDFQLRQDMLQNPEIKAPIEAFVAEADRLRGLVQNAQGFWKTKYQAEFSDLEQNFAAGMQQLGIRNPIEAIGLVKLYQGGEGTRLPIQHTFGSGGTSAITKAMQDTSHAKIPPTGDVSPLGRRIQEKAVFDTAKQQQDFALKQIEDMQSKGLGVLDVSKITGRISQIIDDPKLGSSENVSKVVSDIGSQIQKWVDKGGGTIDPYALYMTRKEAINEAATKLLGGADPVASKRLSAKVSTELKPLIDDALENAYPGWKKYLKSYEGLSRPINEMEVGREFQSALTAPLGTERAASFAARVRKSKETVLPETGKTEFERLSMNSRKAVGKITQELMRDVEKRDLGKSVDTKHLLQIADKEKGAITIPAMISRPATITNWILKKMGKGADDEIAHDMGKLMLSNPQEFSRKYLQDVPKSKREMMIEAIKQKAYQAAIPAVVSAQGD